MTASFAKFCRGPRTGYLLSLSIPAIVLSSSLAQAAGLGVGASAGAGHAGVSAGASVGGASAGTSASAGHAGASVGASAGTSSVGNGASASAGAAAGAGRSAASASVGAGTAAGVGASTGMSAGSSGAPSAGVTGGASAAGGLSQGAAVSGGVSAGASPTGAAASASGFAGGSLGATQSASQTRSIPTKDAANPLKDNEAGVVQTFRRNDEALALYIQRGIGSLSSDYHVHCSTEFCRTHLLGSGVMTPTIRPAVARRIVERYRTFDAVILAAERGNPDAEFMVAEVLAGGHGVPANPRRAALWYGRASNHGNTLAAARLNRLRGALADSE